MRSLTECSVKPIDLSSTIEAFFLYRGVKLFLILLFILSGTAFADHTIRCECEQVKVNHVIASTISTSICTVVEDYNTICTVHIGAVSHTESSTSTSKDDQDSHFNTVPTDLDNVVSDLSTIAARQISPSPFFGRDELMRASGEAINRYLIYTLVAGLVTLVPENWEYLTNVAGDNNIDALEELTTRLAEELYDSLSGQVDSRVFVSLGEEPPIYVDVQLGSEPIQLAITPGCAVLAAGSGPPFLVLVHTHVKLYPDPLPLNECFSLLEE